MKVVLVFAFLMAMAVTFVEPHGYLLTPLARTSVHRLPNRPFTPPYEWNDTGIECSTAVNGQPCGRCGGSTGNTNNNRGGAHDKSVITGTYNSGSIIDAVFRVTANHRGYVEYDLCTSETETDGCFQRLQIVGGSMPIRSGNMMCTGGDHQNHDVTSRLQLPTNFRCNRCTLRMTYRTSYPPAPDACFNGNTVQTFRNCADITIR